MRLHLQIPVVLAFCSVVLRPHRYRWSKQMLCKPTNQRDRRPAHLIRAEDGHGLACWGRYVFGSSIVGLRTRHCASWPLAWTPCGLARAVLPAVVAMNCFGRPQLATQSSDDVTRLGSNCLVGPTPLAAVRYATQTVPSSSIPRA